MFEWDYKGFDMEKEYSGLNIMPLAQYCRLSEEEQWKVVDDLVRQIRKINIYPIKYFDEQGILDEIKKVQDKQAGDFHNKYAQGSLLLEYLFPNLHKVRSCGSYDCLYDRFYDDAKLRKIIHCQLAHGPLTSMRSTFIMNGRLLFATASNFPPMRAKAIIEAFCPENGIIYDYACGFGGRMLGCLASKKNYTYIGCEPCSETYENLLKLGYYINKSINKNQYILYKECSEDLILDKESVDFAFSCPPYYKVEHYSDESTQCTNKYRTYKDWLDYYMKPTILNCFNAVKNGGKYGVVIANCAYSGRPFYIKDEWIKHSEAVGFKLQGEYELKNSMRKENKEKLYIFNKEI